MKPSLYPFLLVMFAVLMGMGVVRLVSAIASYLRNPGKVRPYWVYFAWVGFLLLLYLHVWWSLWEFQGIESWNYFTYLFMLLGPISLYVATAILIPDAGNTGDSDSRAAYFSVHRAFFGTLAVAVAWGMSLYPVLLGRPDPVLGWLLLFLAVVVVLAAVRHPAVHGVLTLVSWALFLVWVLSYGYSLETG